MPKNTKQIILRFCFCLSFLSTALMTLPSGSNAQISSHSQSDTPSDAPQFQPPPPSRPGMSEYQPVHYDNSVSVTETSNANPPKGQGLPGSEPSQSPSRPYNGPSVTVPGTGIRAYFNAPVPPPYNANASYDTFAGQPGGNRSTILQQDNNR